jgi:hypothetical protein
MKIRSFCISRSEVRKNDLRIALITHDLDSAYTLPTPQNPLLEGRWV